MTHQKKNKGRAKAPKGGGCPLWMMTFGDAMSLLVTFFVMLIAFSDPEEDQLSAAIGAMRGALGAVPFVNTKGRNKEALLQDFSQKDEVTLSNIAQGRGSQAMYLTKDELADIIPRLIQYLGEKSNAPEKDRVMIQWVSEGLSIVILTDSLFAKGQDTMLRDYSELWDGIAKLLAGWDNEFRITAILSADHPVRVRTASTPLGLGILRAQQVADRLQNAMQSSATQFAIGAEVPSSLDGNSPEEKIEIIISPPDYLVDIGNENTWPAEIWR
jgi:chemotaxis protein MotB